MAAAGDDVVAGRDEGLRRGEVPPAARGCVARETEHCAPGRTDEQTAVKRVEGMLTKKAA